MRYSIRQISLNNNCHHDKRAIECGFDGIEIHGKEETKLLVAGGISTYEKMLDALNYVDVIAMGRATLIDPQIVYKLMHNMQDQLKDKCNINI